MPATAVRTGTCAAEGPAENTSVLWARPYVWVGSLIGPLPPDLLETSLTVLLVTLFEASPCTLPPDLLETSLAVLPVTLFEASPCTLPPDLLETSLAVLPVTLFEASPCTVALFEASPCTVVLFEPSPLTFAVALFGTSTSTTAWPLGRISPSKIRSISASLICIPAVTSSLTPGLSRSPATNVPFVLPRSSSNHRSLLSAPSLARTNRAWTPDKG